MTQSAALILSALGCVAIAFVIALVITPLSIRISKRVGAMDVPTDGRRMHKAPVPRLGGIAIFLSFLISAFILRALIG